MSTKILLPTQPAVLDVLNPSESQFHHRVVQVVSSPAVSLAVWRNPSNDFGDGLLKRHYESAH